MKLIKIDRGLLFYKIQLGINRGNKMCLEIHLEQDHRVPDQVLYNWGSLLEVEEELGIVLAFEYKDGNAYWNAFNGIEFALEKVSINRPTDLGSLIEIVLLTEFTSAKGMKEALRNYWDMQKKGREL